jgi:alkylation response protein AidB-like acyl-CoA dehydrogenase
VTITDTRPAPSAEELVARVRELHPLLERNAAQGEQDRRVVEESITALADAGVFKIAQPKRYGGYATSMRTLLDVCSTVGEADGGTAWVVTLLTVGAWQLGLFPQQAQDDVWKDNPDAKISGVIATTAETVKVSGGYRISGRWYYASGCWHADWTTVGIPVTDDKGQVVDQGSALIPMTDFDIEETWFVAWMKSTGSNCIIARDVFVPDHRILSVTKVAQGVPQNEHTDEARHAISFPILSLILASPPLGMGRKALELVREKADKKPIAYTFFAKQSDSVGFQLQLAEAAMRIDTAHLHAYRAADDLDRAAAAGQQPDQVSRTRVRADTGWAVENIAKAIDVLLYANGAGSFAEANQLQRIWRDSAVAARHGATSPALGYELYAKALLGRTDFPSFFA